LWRAAERAGVFRGSEVDRRDGFIHFSNAAQVVEAAEIHFAGQSGLLLLRIDSAKLGDRLKWEPSRGGALFPHLYGDLDLTAVMLVEHCRLALTVVTFSRSSRIDRPASRNCGRA